MTAADDRFDRPSAEERMRDERSAAGSAEGQEHDTRALLARLGRPHASGGTVIERAALLAEGADFDVAMAWILAHGGMPRRAPPAHRWAACTARGPTAAPPAER